MKIEIIDGKSTYIIDATDVKPDGSFVFSKEEYNKTNCTHIKITSSVTTIGALAFNGCTGLTHIEIPSNVTTICGEAFSGCTGLTHIVIPSSVRNIEDWAFLGCTGLTHIEIPSSVATIRIGVFAGCTGLAHIEIPSGVTNIEDWAFTGCAGLTHIKIPSGLTTLWGLTFAGCTGLNHIEIPSSVTTIGERVFKGCTGLTHIVIPNSVRDINPDAFKNNTNLNFIKINTDNEEEFNHIKGLLPLDLKDAARMATLSNKILKKRVEALEGFYNQTPSISPLFGHKALYADLLGEISSFHISSKLPLVKETKKRIARLAIPANERELEGDYGLNLKETVRELIDHAEVIYKLTQYLLRLCNIVGKNTSANFFSQSSKPSKNADIWSTYNVIEKIINYLLADESKSLSLTEEEKNLIKTKDSLLNLLSGDIQEKIGLNQSEAKPSL